MNKRRNVQPYQIRGVDALFGETETSNLGKEVVSLTQIVLPQQQPRRYFNAQSMQELIESVRQHGILQPLLVRPTQNSNYELVAGERRYRAAKSLNLTEVPVVIREMTDEQALQFALLENLQREDLNPVEETEGILQLLALKLGQPFEYVVGFLQQAAHPERNSVDNVIHREEWQVVQEVFASIGRFTPESFRSNRLPLLNVPDEVLDALRQGQIEYTKARAIARIKDPEQRKSLLDKAITQELSLNQIKEQIALIQNVKQKTTPTSLRGRIEDALRRVKRSKSVDDPKKQRRLEQLLQELESLMLVE
jgi:ParB family chromosome partitioning protein